MRGWMVCTAVSCYVGFRVEFSAMLQTTQAGTHIHHRGTSLDCGK